MFACLSPKSTYIKEKNNLKKSSNAIAKKQQLQCCDKAPFLIFLFCCCFKYLSHIHVQGCQAYGLRATSVNFICQLLMARPYVAAKSSPCWKSMQTGWDFILMDTPCGQSHANADWAHTIM